MTASGTTRRALVVRMDTPELPFLANLVEHGFTAVTQEGWSTVIPDGPTDSARLAAHQTGGFCAEVSSDGSRRSLTVYPATDPHRGPQAELTRQQEMGANGTLSWGGTTDDPVHTPEGDGAGRTVHTVQNVQLAVETIASACDLDAAAASRLENYATSPGSGLVLESVLQLLGAPVIAAKIVESQRQPEDFEDARHFEPRPLGLSMMDAVTLPGSGNGVFSRLHRAGLRHPQWLLALGGAELAAGTALAVAASRGGRGARVLGTASAVLLTDAAGQTALWAAVRAREKS